MKTLKNRPRQLKLDLPLLPRSNQKDNSIFIGSNITSVDHLNNFMAHKNMYRDNELQKINNLNRENSIRLKESHKQLKTALESVEIMVHELKTPLMGLEFILNNSKLKSEHQSILNITYDRFKEIISDINRLDYAYQANLDKRPLQLTDMNEVIEHTFKNIKSMYQLDPMVQFKLNMEVKNINCMINIKDFNYALYNVIKNSYEAIEKSGQITIDVFKLHKNLVIKVTDNGIGIPESLINQVGTKKFTHGKKGGTGIGLYQVRRMLKNCYGSFNFQSQVGTGTTLKLVIPLSNRG